MDVGVRGVDTVFYTKHESRAVPHGTLPRPRFGDRVAHETARNQRCLVRNGCLPSAEQFHNCGTNCQDLFGNSVLGLGLVVMHRLVNIHEQRASLYLDMYVEGERAWGRLQGGSWTSEVSVTDCIRFVDSRNSALVHFPEVAQVHLLLDCELIVQKPASSTPSQHLGGRHPEVRPQLCVGCRCADHRRLRTRTVNPKLPAEHGSGRQRSVEIHWRIVARTGIDGTAAHVAAMVNQRAQIPSPVVSSCGARSRDCTTPLGCARRTRESS